MERVKNGVLTKVLKMQRAIEKLDELTEKFARRFLNASLVFKIQISCISYFVYKLFRVQKFFCSDHLKGEELCIRAF